LFVALLHRQAWAFFASGVAFRPAIHFFISKIFSDEKRSQKSLAAGGTDLFIPFAAAAGYDRHFRNQFAFCQ
jgi:hypothetical protein